MLGHPVPEGAIFHAPDRRRRAVVFTASLRATVERTVADIAAMLTSRTLPPPKSVAMAPGATTFTAIPRGPNSLAMYRDSTSTAPFIDA